MNIGKINDRMLVFGGPYSNLAATRAMRDVAESLNIAPDRIICTGDVVAYCAEPAQTVELIRDWGIHVVMGNCEESLGFEEADCGCGFAADSSCSILSITWYQYATARIDAAQRQWMRDLPRTLEFEMLEKRFKVIHGSVESINQFVFPSTDASLKQQQLDLATVEVLIGGHSGIPFGQALDGRYWLNAGVVGMPANDASSSGWYMLLEPVDALLKVSWHRLEYDFECSHLSTIKAGMREYGQALKDGLWPSMDSLPKVERSQRGQKLAPAVMKL
ncbi:MAG: putative phosphodiesterase [Gammaproteobacteria bacterium]|jgi:predicted phosphodiesterase